LFGYDTRRKVAPGRHMATETRSGTPYVFLSYASADRERALRVTHLLEAQGISVWIDRTSIVGGTSWSAEIVRGIRECVALVVACSDGAVASPNVQQMSDHIGRPVVDSPGLHKYRPLRLLAPRAELNCATESSLHLVDKFARRECRRG